MHRPNGRCNLNDSDWSHHHRRSPTRHSPRYPPRSSTGKWVGRAARNGILKGGDDPPKNADVSSQERRCRNTTTTKPAIGGQKWSVSTKRQIGRLRGGGRSRCRTRFSAPKFPANREKNRELLRTWPSRRFFAPSRRTNSMAWSRIPYESEQGIILAEQGISARETGSFFQAELQLRPRALMAARITHRLALYCAGTTGTERLRRTPGYSRSSFKADEIADLSRGDP
jgi:hypothetical protein